MPIDTTLQAIFMATIVCIPVSNQLQVLFLETRRIYEVRERPSQMYSWSALLTAQLLSELPWNILSSIMLFITWYWTVGFSNDRAGYSLLMMGVVFPLYYTSFAQAVAAMSPNAQISALLFSLLFSFVGTL
jgi:ATP-binding cassette subfamily G (WHITE) protein 2 (SNQ2)